MGRWSQRRLGGGGGAAPSTLIMIATAQETGLMQLTVGYTQNVDAGDFLANQFTLPDDGGVGLSIVQGAGNTLIIDFDIDVTAQSTLDYAGTAIGVLSPQSVAITH
jgi:hypothetical protein